MRAVVALRVTPYVQEGPLQDVLGLVRPDVAPEVGQDAGTVEGVGVLQRGLVVLGEAEPEVLSVVHTSTSFSTPCAVAPGQRFPPGGRHSPRRGGTPGRLSL